MGLKENAVSNVTVDKASRRVVKVEEWCSHWDSFQHVFLPHIRGQFHHSLCVTKWCNFFRHQGFVVFLTTHSCVDKDSWHVMIKIGWPLDKSILDTDVNGLFALPITSMGLTLSHYLLRGSMKRQQKGQLSGVWESRVGNFKFSFDWTTTRNRKILGIFWDCASE